MSSLLQKTKCFHPKFSAFIFIVLNTVFVQLTNVSEEELSPNHKYSDLIEENSPDLVQDHKEVNAELDDYGVKEHQNSEKEITALLEQKYKFRNDETSRRYKIAPVSKEDPVFHEDRQIALVFRSHAARRIVGGMQTTISRYPYNVAISRNGNHWCGGSIIDEQWVLTAGHCFESAFDGDKRKLVPFIVRAGSSFHNRGGYQARVNKVFFPKKYVPGNADYDFALVRLDRPMPIGRNIAVINLPSKDYVTRPEDILVVSGWGSTDESGLGHIPDRLHFVPVPVMDHEECQRSYPFHITPRMLCAGYTTGGKDACNHDSGGPAVRDGVLLGVVSFGGKRCGDPNSPGVYSRVSTISNWVEKTITNNEAHTCPELIDKIKKARQRERDLERFKNRVDQNKKKVKDWLRDTLQSTSFIELAKKKLQDAGYMLRRMNTRAVNITHMNDKTLDEINLNNLIQEKVLSGDGNKSDQLIQTLALQDLIKPNSDEKLLPPMKETEQFPRDLKTLMDYIKE